MGNEEVDLVTVVKPNEKRSLLQKYDIPIDNLSYEYIARCTNVKEIEKIIQILRSGEEGIFPDLIKHGENCLAKLNPKSKILRVEEPVLTRAMLDPEDRKIIDEDIAKWMTEMQCREKDLDEGKSISLNAAIIPQPEIRQASENLRSSESKSTKLKSKPKAKSTASCDYERWEKFDADAELDRIDLQDEIRQANAKSGQKILREKYEEAKKLSRESVVDKLSLTATELSVMAEQEKNIGNEAYRAGDYEEALIRYNSSININSNINAYNNRAITNIKLQRYENAVRDCDMALSIEYNNVTALMRRGLALENLEKKTEALIDYQTILQIEPNNKIAIAAVNKLRKPSDSKKVRMKIEEKEEEDEKNSDNEIKNCVESKKVEERSSKNEFENKVNRVLSEICFCDRAPGFSQNPKPPPHYKSNYCLPIKKLDKSNNNNNIRQSKSENSYFFNIDKNQSADKLIIEELPSEFLKPTSEKNFDEFARGDRIREIKGIKNSIDSKKSSDFMEKNKFEKELEKNESESESINNNKIILCEKPSIPKNIESPYEFIHIWQSLKNHSDLSHHAKLLRSLSPDDLINVIGNKLDGDMFGLIIRCLEKYFCNINEIDIIHRYVDSIRKIKRFTIVRLFMDEDDKKVLKKILNFLEDNISSEDHAVLCEAYDII